MLYKNNSASIIYLSAFLGFSVLLLWKRALNVVVEGVISRVLLMKDEVVVVVIGC